MGLTVRMGIRIRAPREFVFQHLLTAHHMARWFCNFAQFDTRGPAVGSKFRFGGDYAIAGTEPPGWTCEILGGEVLRSVSFRWPLFGADTRVDWRVEDASEGSTIHVVHSVLPREDTTCGTFVDAWRICLGNLKAITEARDDSLRPDSTPITEPRMKFDLLVDAPRAKVLDALTQPDAVRRWAETSEPAIDPRVGGKFEIGWPQSRAGVIEAIEPAKGLVVKWSGDARMSIRLEEKSGNRSGVYVAYEGFPIQNPQDALRTRCNGAALLVGLKNFLEAGDPGFTEPHGEQSVHE